MSNPPSNRPGEIADKAAGPVGPASQAGAANGTNLSRSLIWGIASLASAVIGFFAGLFSVFLAGFALYAGLKARKLGALEQDNAAVICGTIGLIVSAITLAFIAFGLAMLLLTTMGILGIASMPFLLR